MGAGAAVKERVKPKLRGVSHQYAAAAALTVGIALVAFAPTPRAALAAAVYAASLAVLLGISALYHRPYWPPPVRRILRRIDHGAIFVLIAGTGTPFFMLALPPGRGTAVLIAIWAGAAAGIAKSIFWTDAPRWILPILCVALGWASFPYLSEIHAAAGTTAIALIAAGGALYTVGAVVYALRRPDPFPTVFGYHEVFHALVVFASACHFVAVAPVVLAAH
jgi:hemolysin III